MNYFILFSVMNVFLMISTVVSVAYAQSGEDYYEETYDCQTLLECWESEVENFIYDPHFLSNITVFEFCEVFDEFKLCVDRNKAYCSNINHHLAADNVKAMDNIVCDAAGRSAVEELETSQCLIDGTKKQRVLDAVDTCYYRDNHICSNDPTEQKRCVREAIQGDCGENGARVFASVEWENILEDHTRLVK